MKKTITKLIVIFLITVSIYTYTKAYTNKYFEVDIPDNYKLNEEETLLDIEAKDKTVFIEISIKNNTYKEDIAKTNEEKIKENIKEEFNNNGFNNIKIEKIINTTINSHNSKKVNITAEVENIPVYTESYCITTENYIYTIFTMATSDKYLSSQEYKNIINSVKILDSKLTTTKNNKTNNDIKSNNDKSENEIFWGATAQGLISAIPFVIIVYFINKWRKNKKKEGNNSEK